MAVFTAVLFLFTCLKVVLCSTSGFMQLDLLKRRAENLFSVSNTSLPHQLRVVPGLRFQCAGSITSLLVVAKISAAGGIRNSYPIIEIWKNDSFNTQLTRQTMREIRLAAGDFSPDGVLQHNLSPPLPFQNLDVLGVYQPVPSQSVVQLFYADDPAASYITHIQPANYEIIDVFAQEPINQSTLIIPITDPSSGCTTDNFFTSEKLKQAALEVNISSVVVRNQQQRVFPDINFTASGSITKWIVGAGTGGGSSPPSELQIWRRSGSDYTKVGSTQLTAQSPTSDPNVYEYIPSPPLGFQEGDILGVYQRDDSSIVPYYQESTGPENLRQSGLVSSAPNSLTAPVLAAEYDYPLVTVETGSPLTTSILPSSTVQLVPSNPSDSNHLSLVHSSDPLPTSSANEESNSLLNNLMTSTSSATVESLTATVISVSPKLTASVESLTIASMTALLSMSATPLETDTTSADAVTITIISSGVFLVGILALIIVIVLATLTIYKRKKTKVEISDQNGGELHADYADLHIPLQERPQTSNFSTSQSAVYATITDYEVPIRSFVEPTPYELPVPLTGQQKKAFEASPHEEVELHENVCYSSARNNNDEQVQLHQNVCYGSPLARAIDKEVKIQHNVCYSTRTSSTDDRSGNEYSEVVCRGSGLC